MNKWVYTYQKEVEIYPAEIYRRSWDIPKDYEIADFRPPKKGEKYLTAYADDVWVCEDDYISSSPRFILKPKPRRRKWLVEEDPEGKQSGWFFGEIVCTSNRPRAFADEISVSVREVTEDE